MKKILVALVFILFVILFYLTINNYFVGSYGYASSSAMLKKVKDYSASELHGSRDIDFVTNSKMSYYLEINTNRFKILFSQSVLFLFLLFLLLSLFIGLLCSVQKQSQKIKS